METLAAVHNKAESIAALQQTLDQSMIRLAEANRAAERSVTASAGDGMADAMRILARAVDILAKRLAQSDAKQSSSGSRRAA